MRVASEQPAIKFSGAGATENLRAVRERGADRLAESEREVKKCLQYSEVQNIMSIVINPII